MRFVIVFLCFKLFFERVYSSNLIGNSCVDHGTNPGKCKLENDCLQQRNHKVCGYYRLQKIVCCASENKNTLNRNTFTSAQLSTKRHKKCLEYQSAIYVNQSDGFTLSLGSRPVINQVEKCYFDAVPLIIGGKPASVREFPHSARLGYLTQDNDITWDCGGSLISESFVLTAAHCLKNSDGISVETVRLGDSSIESDDHYPIQEFGVLHAIPHPEYGRHGNNEMRTTKKYNYNDIALIQLNGIVDINPYIRPICLPLNDDIPPKVFATGWGTIDQYNTRSNDLMKVTLESFTQDECKTSFPPSYRLPYSIVETQMCYGSRTESKDTCGGDSGGPLQIYHPSIYCVYIIVGITSFGYSCGTINVPGVYTRIEPYINWIERIVWP